MVTKIDNFGRVLIPKKIRRKLGFLPGVTVQLEEINNQIILKVNPAPERKIGEDKDLIEISDDFDAPLEDFEDYMS